MIKTTGNVSKVASVPVLKNIIISVEKTEKKLKILHLEDVSSDALLVYNILKKGNLECIILVVDTKDKFTKELKKFSPDIILADHSLPSFNSHQALTILHETGFEIPFILVTATMSDELAVEIIKKGADDYVLKDRLNRLPSAIQNALENYSLKRAKKFIIDELISSQIHLKEAQAVAKVGSWETDLKSLNVKWSEETHHIYETDPKTYRPTHEGFLDFIHPDDRDTINTTFENSLHTQTINSVEHRVIATNGTLKYVTENWKIYLDGQGSPVRAVGTCQDITERKIAEQKLAESEKNLHHVLSSSLDSFYVINRKGYVTLINKTASENLEKAWGKPVTVGTNIFDLIPNENDEPIRSSLLKVFAGETVEYELHLFVKYLPAWLQVNYLPVKDDAGSVKGAYIVTKDITEKKLAQDLLIESEQFNKGILASLSSHIAVIETTGNIIAVNKAWDNFAKNNGVDSLNGVSTGSNYIEVCQRSMASGDSIAAKTLLGLQSVINKEVKTFELEYPCHSLDQQRWFNLSIMNFGEDDEKIVLSHQNITGRKIAENNLKAASIDLGKALTDLNKILDSSLDVICTINSNGEFVKVSAASQQVWGYTPEELIGTRFMNLVYEEDVDRTTKAAEKLYNGIQVPIFENRYVHKSGKVVPLLWSVNWDEKLQLMFCIAKDVTEKRNLEDLLNKSNRLARIGSWEYNTITKTHFWSGITREIYEVKDDIVPDLKTGITFYKSGVSRSSISNAVNKALKDGTPWDLELQIVTATGNELWVRDIGEAEFLKGKCIRLYGSFQDIDARKKAEIEKLTAYQERNVILESIGDGFYALDKNWVITYWNKHAEILLNRSRSEAIGKNLWELSPDARKSISYINYHKAVEEKTIQHYERFNEELDRWLEISAYPSSTGLSVFFKDITERKTSEEKVKKLNEELDNHGKELAISNAELERFAYVASHDLQEPLRMVTGFLSQIEKKYGTLLDDKGKQYIHYAVDGAKRMRQIILDLLEFSRVGQSDDEQEEVKLNELLDEILLLLRKKIEETKAVIKIGILPILKTFRSPLLQVFQNLISNALKYHISGVAPIINISSEETETHWQFAISDNGIGIEEEYFDQIFVIFKRLHNKDEYSGTGIGLAITKKIIENLGGKIWLESEEGKGCTFYFTIPKS